MTPDYKDYLSVKPLRKTDQVSFCLKKSEDGHFYIEIIVNGYYDTPDIVHLPNNTNPLKPVIGWLEQVITHGVEKACTLDIGDATLGNKHYQLNYIPDTPDYGRFYIFDYFTGLMKSRSYCNTEDFVRFIYTRMKWDAKKMQKTVYSNEIESFYLSKPVLRFEYKGYSTEVRIKANDLRYYGNIYDCDSPNEKVPNCGFAADNETEARERFEGCVEYTIKQKEWKDKNKAWKESIDCESIGCVFDILPEKFKERLQTEAFDKSLLDGVQGGDYVVPLYYVTKAWDVLLKGELGHLAFMIGPEEDDEDDYEAALQEFMYENRATRTRNDAIKQNDEMKSIWKEMVGVDIDSIDVDFSQFNMHMPPHVSEREYEDYFFDVLNGVFEWVLCGINNPNGNCDFESVSALMEFTALIENKRKECLKPISYFRLRIKGKDSESFG